MGGELQAAPVRVLEGPAPPGVEPEAPAPGGDEGELAPHVEDRVASPGVFPPRASSGPGREGGATGEREEEAAGKPLAHYPPLRM